MAKKRKRSKREMDMIVYNVSVTIGFAITVLLFSLMGYFIIRGLIGAIKYLF